MSSSKKIPVSIRVHESVLDWFKNEQPKGYQTLINSVLEDFVSNKKEHRARLSGRAQEIFNQFYAQCFWHYDRNFKISSDNIQLVVEGLRKHGGRKGLLLAEELCQ